ncbi:acetylornithine transaminase [Planotetraspora phitsanulokensis]|uniref:Acetylornithine aminotransferase n=1 Tax=Planotetraspora phitsanulokensis TaxID=575192 RepID=A0A8J3UF60_9ACTN|nr:acetylornithine transaminase [Planotetraspora phitsanulokensis]GII42567.1 acetylornithine aminotransferase [Planotetraspora phitsanulokensis]
MSNSDALRKRFESVFMPNYGVPPVAIARGEGSVVWDADGRRYLDLIGGIAVSSLGHGHPALVEAVSRQVATLAHTSNLFLHEPEVLLAERLVGLLRAPGRVFLANSGTEANEAALKLAIKYGKAHGKSYFVATEMGFHGRTMGALSLTGKPAIRDQFGPFPVDVRFVPYGDADALKNAVTGECAAVFLEPTQGEAGVVPPPDGYLRAAREICSATGALLVADEIQSAIGRTGHWFAHQADGVVPDILTLAKGLGGGMPIGACIGIGPAGTIFDKGDHGSTFGGNPVSSAAALAVLDTIERDGLLEHVATVGRRLAEGIAAVDHPLLAGVRGRGLWLATVLAADRSAQVQAAAQEAGFLVNALQPDAVRLAPPLVITMPEVESFLDALPGILEAAR